MRPVFFVFSLIFFVQSSLAQDYMRKVNEASEFINNRQYEKAIEAGLVLSKSDTVTVSGFGFMVVGKAYYALNDDDKALFYFYKAEPLLPNAGLFSNKGQIFLERYELDSAISNYTQAFDLIDSLTLFEDQYNIFTNLGVLYAEVGELELAIEFLKQSTEMDRSNWKPYYQLSDIYALNYQFEESLAYADTALSKEGSDQVSIKYLIASGNFFLGNVEEATSLAYTIKEDTSVAFSTSRLMGMIHDRQSNLDSSYYYFSQALEMYPDDVASLNNLAWTCIRKGEYDEARPLLIKALEIDIQFPFAYSNLAYVYFKTGEISRALVYANSAIDLDDSNTYAYAFRANIYFEMDDLDNACRDIEKVTPGNNYPNAREVALIRETCDKK